MSSSEARQHYRNRYGSNVPTRHSGWTRRPDVSFVATLGDFLWTTGMEDTQARGCFTILSCLHHETVTNFVLPSLVLMEADIIGYITLLLPRVANFFLPGFVQSFAALTRNHQFRFLDYAGTVHSSQLAPMMSDIFMKPDSPPVIDVLTGVRPFFQQPEQGSQHMAGYAQSAPMNQHTQQPQHVPVAPSNGFQTSQSPQPFPPQYAQPVPQAPIQQAHQQQQIPSGPSTQPVPNGRNAQPPVSTAPTANTPAQTPYRPARPEVVDLTDDSTQAAQTAQKVQSAQNIQTAPAAQATPVAQTAPVEQIAPVEQTAQRAQVTAPAPPTQSTQTIEPEIVPARRTAPTPASQPPVPDPLHPETVHILDKVKRLLDQMVKCDNSNPFDAPDLREESSIENVKVNLKVRYPVVTITWPNDVLPAEATFPTAEAAVVDVMLHAFARHYQVVPEFKEGVFFLNCSREGCDFAVKIDSCSIVHIPDRSEHNHMPGVHPKKPADQIDLHALYCAPRDASKTAELERLERTHSIDELVKTAQSWTPSENYNKTAISQTLQDLKMARLEGDTPHNAIAKLFEAPFLRVRYHYRDKPTPNSIFIAHTEGSRLWKTYPELMILHELEAVPVKDKYQQLVMFKGVDCHNETFPIAACVVERHFPQYSIVCETWKWLFKQLKELLDDHKVPHPSFIQANSSSRCIDECEVAFPAAYVYMDPEAADELAYDEASKYYRGYGIDSCLSSWSHVLEAEDEYGMERAMEKLTYPKGTPRNEKKFLEAMEEQMERICSPIKNRHLHFGVSQTSAYVASWETRETHYNVFEMIRCLLHHFVERYEVLARLHGEKLDASKSEFSELLADCLSVISPKALKQVQQLLGKMSPSKYCDCIENAAIGFPCEHKLATITQERKLSPDDFHPHWRHLYADIEGVRVGGKGKYTKEWAALEVGMQKYTSDVTTECGREAQLPLAKRQKTGPTELYI